MVKVIKRGELEAQKKERASDLVRIANATVGTVFQAKISGSNNNVRLVEIEYDEYPMQMWVMSAPHHRVITVEAPRYEDHAKRLAKEYRAAGLGKFIVEAHY